MDNYRISPKQKVKLKDISTKPSGDKDKGLDEFAELHAQLDALQERFYAEGKHRLLIVLQGMDTSGKDGTIRAVFEGVNPQGVRVASFKVPTSEELSHDYLWRIHKQTPGKGEWVIFNRSHYEDVLVVRVHNLVPEGVWSRRYDQINAFERLLVDEGTTILKFFLHISKDAQKERLIERLEMPAKNWKFNPADLKERDLWDQYQKAYEDVLEKTSTDWAPWHVIPADKNWFRNLLICRTLVDTLKNLNIQTSPVLTPAEIEQYKAQLG